MRWLWLAAPAFFLLFYWRGVDCGFYQDDWGWLHIGIAHWPNTLNMLFGPKAHGNMRPWSENLFFFGLYRWFGPDPLPFRIVVFLTVIADLFLLHALVKRLTGSQWAALGAQLFWLVNPSIAPSFCWTCIYNETQYLFFILLALVLLIDGRYWWQVTAFVMSLGSLETAVMYPCLASLYALLYARHKFKSTIPLYGISAIYTVIHFMAAPAQASGPYAMRFDTRIFLTLGRYAAMVLGPSTLAAFEPTWPRWIFAAATMLLAAGAIFAVVVAGRAGWFGAGWFVILLVPVLPLPDHVQDYLLTGPAVGLAIVLGAALASRWRSAVACVATLYLAAALPGAWMKTTWNYERSRESEDFVESIVDFGQANPGKELLLTGLSTGQFFSGFVDLPFELYGMHNVHLAPEADAAILDPRHLAALFVMPPERVRTLIQNGQAIVLDVSTGEIRNQTHFYRLLLDTEAAHGR